MTTEEKTKVKFWTEREQTRFLAGFVLGTVLTMTGMIIAFYNGYGT